MLKPDLQVSDITFLTPELLRQHGLNAVMVDLDDTLVPSGGDSMEVRFTEWFTALRDDGIDLLILSNGQRDRVAHWAHSLGIPGLSLVGKPFRYAFRRGLKMLGSEPARTAMVGDQLFTDVLGANLMGLFSVLVTPLSPGKLPHTRLLRRVEKRILRRGNGEPVDR